jgi:hypothetical protein
MYVHKILFKKIMELIILLQVKLINHLKILYLKNYKQEFKLNIKIKNLGKLLNINRLEINMII